MARARMASAEFNGISYPVAYDRWNSPIVYLPCDICGVPKKVHISRKHEISLTCISCSNKSEERARKISATKTGVPKTEKEKRKLSESVKRYLAENPYTEEDKLRRSISLRDREPWNKGKELTEEDRLHKSIAQKIAQPKYAVAQKERWNNLSKEEKEDRISKSLSRSSQRPNVPEMKILALLEYLYSGEYKYTGNGEVTLGDMCPDFTNINGQKKVIEHFGEYWHKGENPNEIISRYLEYGFKCLVIWEHELEEPEKVIERINAFHKGGDETTVAKSNVTLIEAPMNRNVAFVSNDD